ncbi:hypothetical protein [Intestinibacter bartlettii]|uniref:Uncharacterized protein n=1 Tax=Intestinibacter bartlettii TaxID=261299 RepID=A0ABS6E199_9FIRM|nr:hypothetical protein [Intestinibacter bartlettii]MBU5337559.1 hypothetical protein [Intestinibacter bartlettii]
MRNSNADNTILFIEKKKEFENSKDNQNHHKITIKDKNAEIISLSSYKRLKFKRNHFKKEHNINIDKSKLKKRAFFIIILVLFLLILASTVLKQNSYSEVPSNKFVAQSSEINKSDTSAYKSIIKRVVGKYTNANNISISELHKNGNLVYAQGYFNVPNEGKVNYDLILQNNSPTSLIINGNEYIK